MKQIETRMLRELDILRLTDRIFGKRSNKMRIKFIAPKVMRGKVKCAVHQNGKLGFSQAAIKMLGIDNSYYAKIGINEEDANDDSLYMLLSQQGDEESFKINKAGNYFYLNTRNLFDELRIDYKENKIIYDIEEITHEGRTLYKLNMRIIERNK